LEIIITGDFCPTHLTHSDPKKAYGDLYDEFNNCDLFITNLEGSLFKGKARKKQGPNLYIDKKYLTLLNLNSDVVCCLANNHSYDFGLEGLNQTCYMLSKENITCLGVIRKPFVTDGIAIFNMCEDEGGGDDIFTYDIISLLREIKEYPKEKKIIILHGGNEGFPYPNPDQQKLSRFLIDSGVELVVWHHNHMPSTYEEYNGKMIYYGLGNFLFKNAYSNLGYFVIYDTKTGKSKVKGYTLSDERIKPCSIESTLNEINKADWKDKWRIFASMEYRDRYERWIKIFANSNAWADTLNFYQCESHRRLIIDGIKDHHPG